MESEKRPSNDPPYPNLTVEQWAEIDGYIAEHNGFLAVKAIHDYAGIRLSEAIRIHANRYRQVWDAREQGESGSTT